jgi:hypothetical protein
MSTHSESVACPNCHVSHQTAVATRLINRDEDGISDSVYCRLCRFLGLTPQSTDRHYHGRQYLGDPVPVEDVPARARAVMVDDGWTDEAIEETVESWVDLEWLEIARGGPAAKLNLERRE